MTLARELMTANPHQGILVYGRTGSGKTSFGARSPRPFVVLTEDNGVPTIARWNPGADVEVVRDWRDFVGFCDALTKGSPRTVDGQPGYGFTWRGSARSCQTVVIDSFGDVQEMLFRAVGGPEEELTQKDWGTVYRMARRVLKEGLRAVPVCKVVITHSMEDVDENGYRRVRPALSGKLANWIGAWHAAVGYARTRRHENRMIHEVCWRLGDSYDTKPAPGFPVVSEMTSTPGQTTLGSLLLAQAERCYDGDVVVPHYEHDNVRFVGPAADGSDSKGGMAT